MIYRVLWWFDALIAAVFLYFFFIGLADGSVSSFNMGLWLFTLAALAAVLAGSHALKASAHPKAAVSLLLVLAIPGAIGVLFMLVVLTTQTRWN